MSQSLKKHDLNPLFLTPYKEGFLLLGGDEMGKPPWGFDAPNHLSQGFSTNDKG
jgi:hypothetical protein